MRPASDSEDLARAGYRQELARDLGRFSSFAASFSYISILTGVFQNFHLGFAAGGPAFFWTWPLMFLGQLLVALCFAELASHYPYCGGVYQWSRHLSGAALGRLTGFVYLASLIVTLAAVALALQITLPQIWPGFQIIGDGSSAADRTRNAVLLGCALIALSTVINAVGVRLLAFINNFGVMLELLGVSLLIVLLFLRAARGPQVVLDSAGRGEGTAYLQPFLLAGITASYVLYGFDTAGALAEETRAPRRTAPRAILSALCAAALAGGLLLLAALMAAPDVRAAALSSPSGGLPYIVTATLGVGLGKLFLCAVIFSVTVCLLAVQGSAVRLLFAMARDGRSRLSRRLAAVSPRSHVPLLPTLLCGALAALLLLCNQNAPRMIETIIAVSVVWANLAYLLVVGTLLWRRLRGWPPQEGEERFRLGRAGLLVNGLAVVWSLLVVVNMAWPREAIYGAPWYQRYAAVWLTAGLLLLGAGLSFRRRT